MRIVFDIEANGFTPDKIWCICCQDVDNPEDTRSFYGDTLFQGVLFLAEADEIIGHNIISYDIPALESVFKVKFRNKFTDTLIISRMLNPDRLGGHSLQSYGEHFNTDKIQHEDWSQFSPEMLERCIRDVEINVKLFKAQEIEISRNRQQWTYSIELEHKVAKIIDEQAISGWYFESEKADNMILDLEKQVSEIDIEVDHLLLPKVCFKTLVDKPFNKDGKLSQKALKFVESCNGPFSVIEYVKPDINSETQVKTLLLELGWKPTEWNYKKDKFKKIMNDAYGDPIKASPKITEDSFDSLPEGLGSHIASRFKCRHRLALLKGLLKEVRSDHRIPAKAMSCATNTARMRHQVVVNIPKAKPNIFLGIECRSLFSAPKDRILVGCDASALEARCLAHYINDYLFTKELLESDIHTTFQKLANLETRDQAKTLVYATLYGAGDKKIGKIVGGSLEEGKSLRKQLYLKCPRLEELTKGVTEKAKSKLPLTAIDKRLIFYRSSHSALNTLLQACGAIIMKVALVNAYEQIKEEGLDAFEIGTHHDEITYECSKKDAERVAIILRWAIIKAGDDLNLRCPLDAESKIGSNWAEIH